MPRVQYLGPYDRREIGAAELGREPAPTPEGEEPAPPEIIAWDRDGEFVDLTDEEWTKLRNATGGSSWAIEEVEHAAIDESSAQPESAQSVPGSDQEAGQTA
jgi:hypothetical protein